MKERTIDWTPALLRDFTAAHEGAVEVRSTTFFFESHSFDTGYAGQLITYLTNEFEKLASQGTK